jgi:threonyl-tRNA synthetase
LTFKTFILNVTHLPLLFRSAAEITAAAVYELFPLIEILDARASSAGFVCDLYFPHPVHPQTISMIEERIRQIVREKRPIRTLEMVPVSAPGLLQSLGFRGQAERLGESEGLVELVQIGSFHNLSPGPHLKNTAELAAFKLLSIEFLESKVIRIRGSASPSKKELREFLKKQELYAACCHQKLGAGLWVDLDGAVIWQGQGLRLKGQVVEFLKRRLFLDAVEVAGSPKLGEDRFEFHSEILKKIGGSFRSIAEVWTRFNEKEGGDTGLFEPGEEGIVQLSVYPRIEDLQAKLISSLQSIGKTLNILGFNYCLELACRKRVEKGFLEFLKAAEESLGVGFEVREEGKPLQAEFLVEDALGRRWSAVTLKQTKKEPKNEKGSSPYIIEASVEKITALLIERYLLKMNCEELIDMMVQL